MRDDQRRLGVALDECAQARGDRRQASPAVDQDRDAPLGGDLEHRPEPLVGGGEFLRARVQLDPVRAGVEAAARLLDRLLVQIEADERDQPAVERSANASVRSFAALNDGCRSGSSRQNMKAREMPYLRHVRSSWS